jgi:hypothetical protein
MDRREFVGSLAAGAVVLAVPALAVARENRLQIGSETLDKIIDTNIMVYDQDKESALFDDESLRIVEGVFRYRTDMSYSSTEEITKIIVSKKVKINLTKNVEIIRNEYITPYWLSHDACLVDGKYVKYKHTQILLATTRDGKTLPFSI